GSEKYGVAESEPIPIVVRPTRVVTASDAEGLVQGPGGSPLEKWKEGIAFNYEGPGVLSDQGAGLETIYGDLRIVSFLLAFPLLFFATAISRNILVTRSADPARVRARGALRRLNARLQEASRRSGSGGGEFSQSVMDALKEYLGDKLDRSGAALTADEVGRLLLKRDIDGETVSVIREVLGECEMWAYSGGADDAGRRKHLSDRVSEAARLLDRKI
ncbi:MAG TPA: hypothetical protein VLA34_15295, partial [Candidatus Krumholzibacterium sp.]|nr:hypothetical protein [Candidatus Krumholzibacterium sp.]